MIFRVVGTSLRRRHSSLRPLRGFVFGFLLERLPDCFKTNEAFFVCRFLARRHKACVAIRNFGDWFLLAAHKSPFALKLGLSLKQVAGVTGRQPLARRSLRPLLLLYRLARARSRS